jgi:hypothetical protein
MEESETNLQSWIRTHCTKILWFYQSQ